MRLLIVALALLVVVPTALGAFDGHEQLRAYVPTLAEQHRAIAAVYRRHAVVSCGGGRSDAVALTFDDGPGPYTADVLHVLRERGASATFFVVGNRLQYWPELARAEARLGAVGDHTWSHPRLTQISHWLVWLELMRTQYELRSSLGSRPLLFRTPYAMHSPAIDAVVRKLGLVEVFWNVDPRDDVRNARPADIVRAVADNLRPGAIVLLHDIHPWTLRALPGILDAIARRGLRAVSVPELLALDPPHPGQHCPYGPVPVGA
jgi:peptidoglycan/xylan/chitin deacetylase (PgdA/CDA1 family)